MIAGKSVLAVIPARGGSKGLPRKNILSFAGKPLLAWTIETAQACPYIDRLLVSSEDEEIISTARQWGCEVPFVRPLELATDQATAVQVAKHVLQSLSETYDYLVWLQPTSPLRLSEDITQCLSICVQEGVLACVSVTEAGKSPYWMYSLNKHNELQPILAEDFSRHNRQALPVVYALNGAILVCRVDHFLEKGYFMNGKTRGYVMPTQRSWDIDTELDFRIAEFLQQDILNKKQ
ncbi:MAG: acylneuraminate cytidylyltransferase family protein [Magnetococcus sp. DMHC-6]